MPSRGPARRANGARLALALTACALFALQFSSSGLQQDDWYHLAMAQMIWEQGVPDVLPWARHTLLAQSFADLHYLYHVILIPFVRFFAPVTAGKLAAAGLAVGVVALVMGIARGLGAGRWSWLVGVSMLVSSSAFTTRLLGVRPIGLTAAAVLGALALAQTKRALALFALSGALTLTSAGFPLLLLPLGAHLLGTALMERTFDWRPVVAMTLGIGAGLMAHPSYPDHLEVLWVQLTEVGSRGPVHNLEWAPATWTSLGENTWLAVAGSLGCVAMLLARGLRPPSWLVPWALLTAFAFALMLRHARAIDLFIPAASLFVGLTASVTHPQGLKKNHGVLLGIALLLVGVIHGRRAVADYAALERRDNQSCARWLEGHTPEGAEVFLPDYASFPQLFFHDRHNVYTLAFDPGFMWAYSPSLFEHYARIVAGRGDIASVIGETFGARYVYTENTTQGRPLYEAMSARPHEFRKRYQDEFAAVFEVQAAASPPPRDGEVP